MNRFFAYEEYGAKYELMVKDVASTYRTMPQWEAYQKGLEALAASLSSVNTQHERSKKSLTVGDLLIKVAVHLYLVRALLICHYSQFREFADIHFCLQNS